MFNLSKKLMQGFFASILLSSVFTFNAKAQEQEKFPEKILDQAIEASPTKIRFYLTNQSTGEVIYTQDQQLKPDSTGNISYMFGKEFLDQAILSELKSNNEKFLIKFDVIPASEPAIKKLYVEKIVKEEVIVRDTIVKEITKRVLTKSEQKEFEKEMKENLKKSKKTGIIPYCANFDPKKEVFVYLNERYIASEKSIAADLALTAKEITINEELVLPDTSSITSTETAQQINKGAQAAADKATQFLFDKTVAKFINTQVGKIKDKHAIKIDHLAAKSIAKTFKIKLDSNKAIDEQLSGKI